jgi:hypothetical protein
VGCCWHVAVGDMPSCFLPKNETLSKPGVGPSLAWLVTLSFAVGLSSFAVNFLRLPWWDSLRLP